MAVTIVQRLLGGFSRRAGSAAPKTSKAVHRPGNPASAIYGSVVVAGQLAIESSNDQRHVPAILASLAATLAVFWLAHAYADVLGQAARSEADVPSFPHALRVELPILESGAIPALVVLTTFLFGASSQGAGFAGLLAAAAELGGWVILASRRAGQRRSTQITHLFMGIFVGSVLVLLKFLLH